MPPHSLRVLLGGIERLGARHAELLRERLVLRTQLGHFAHEERVQHLVGLLLQVGTRLLQRLERTAGLAQLLLKHRYLRAARGGVRVVPRALLHLQDLQLLAQGLAQTLVYVKVLAEQHGAGSNTRP